MKTINLLLECGKKYKIKDNTTLNNVIILSNERCNLCKGKKEIKAIIDNEEKVIICPECFGKGIKSFYKKVKKERIVILSEIIIQPKEITYYVYCVDGIEQSEYDFSEEEIKELIEKNLIEEVE